MAVYGGTDNIALADISKSSKRLESLTLVLIFITIILAVLEFPRFRTEIIGDSSVAPELLAFAVLIVFVAYVIWFRDSVFRALKSVFGFFVNIVFRPKVIAAKKTGTTTYVLGENVQFANKPTLNDLQAAGFLLIISIVFLWLSYQLQAVFPATVGNVMGDLILSMWIIFVASIIIIVIVLYRFFKR